MLSSIWNTLLYQPFVNILAFLISIIPGGDVGIAIILLTFLVKLLLFPLSQKSLENQAKTSALSPLLNEIKASGATKEEQARRTFELYKKHKANPFSGCLLVLVQIPVIFALYFVFYKGIAFNSDILYSFIPVPENVNMNFLGLIDIASKSAVLAALAGISQYLQAHFIPKPPAPPSPPRRYRGRLCRKLSEEHAFTDEIFFPNYCRDNLLQHLRSHCPLLAY